MNDITVIIPVDSWGEESQEYIERNFQCLFKQSSPPQAVHFIVNFDETDEWKDYLKKIIEQFSSIEVEVFKTVNDSGKCFQQILTEIISPAGFSKWFIVSPYTDYFENPGYFTWIDKYRVEDMDIKAFAPIVKVFSEDDKFLHFDNVQYHAESFSEVIGEPDVDTLKLMYEMTLYGTVWNTASFIKAGGLKTHFEEFYWYEFLLRFIDSGNRLYVIPKSAYTHILKPDSKLPADMEFYYKKAQSEYLFKTDRVLNKVEVNDV